MDNIIEPNIDYDFSKIYLGPPSTLSGGAYFTKIMHNTNKQLFIQTPKSLTKQGFVKNGKKIYTDLMFDNNDTVFINWIENLETKCQELIFNKSDKWFETKLEKDDIETAFTSPFKIFKSGKFYLLRVNVKPNIKIYKESDQNVTVDDVTIDTNIISILEIQGIKFTSRNFQIEIELKQSMIVSPDPFLDECFIKKPIRKSHLKEVTIAEPEVNIIETNKNVFKNDNKEDVSLEEFIEASAKDILNINNTNTNTNTNTKINNTLEQIENHIDLELSVEEIKEISDSSNNYNNDNNDNNDNNNENNDNNNENNDNENIMLDIEDLCVPQLKEDPNMLKEIDLTSNLENNLETIILKKPNQVYYEIYKKARVKAKEAKKAAILAYLEAKNIKKTYMLDDIDESDDSDDSDDESETSDNNFNEDF